MQALGYANQPRSLLFLPLAVKDHLAISGGVTMVDVNTEYDDTPYTAAFVEPSALMSWPHIKLIDLYARMRPSSRVVGVLGHCRGQP